MEHEEAFVLVPGSKNISYGFTNIDQPSHKFTNVVGKTLANSNEEKTFFVGPEALARDAGELTLHYPIERGLVEDWELMEKMWCYAFKSSSVNSPVENPILLGEDVLSPTSQRECMAEMLFETFCVPYLFTALNPTLAMFGSGRSTGLCVGSGHGVSCVAAYTQSTLFSKSIGKCDLGGLDVTLSLIKHLNKQHPSISCISTANIEMINTMKEEVCHVSTKEKIDEKAKKQSYKLPDGSFIQLGPEVSEATEVIFHPESFGLNEIGLQDMIYNSLKNCPLDSRRELCHTILLYGGNTNLTGFSQRLKSELQQQFELTIRIVESEDKENLPWFGGCVLGTLSSFQENWISKNYYEEHGSRALQKFIL